MSAVPLPGLTQDTGPYWPLIVQSAPRTLSLMDRDPFSPTAGCCDRTYWAWKFTDFPGSRFQEALCVLAYLYSAPIRGNPFHEQPELAGWLDLGFRYWCRLQHADGSFDEAYPFERSLAATSFTSFYVAEALKLAGSAVSETTDAAVRMALERAGDWLCRNDETHGFLSNHLAAAAAALQHVALLTGKAAFAERSRFFVRRILDHQSSEGWYDEYGGADPGYQTHGTFYLARLLQLTGDQALGDSLDRSAQFLAHFVHPDGSLGGEYASRNTQTYYPAGFEMLAHRSPAAAWIAATMRSSAGTAAAAGLSGVDAWNYFPFLNNLVFASQAHQRERHTGSPADPTPAVGLSWFPKAGLARIRRGRYQAYIGTAKGGVVKVFDRDRRALAYSDCGYVGRLEGGKLCSTQYFDPERPVHCDEEGIEVSGTLMAFARPVMTPFRFIGFRMFSLTVGRIGSLGRWLKRYLVKVLIYRRRPLDLSFRRRIRFGDTGITVEDEIGGPAANQLASLRWGALFTTIHMGSSRYFIENELRSGGAGRLVEVPLEDVRKGTRLTREVRVGGGND